MSLSNRQYQDIMRQYDDIRAKNYRISSARAEQTAAEIPEIRRINEEMASMTGMRVREMLYGNDSREKEATEASYRNRMEAFSARKKQLLTEHGYPSDWLDPVYDCPDCQDTGYIGNEKCHCFMARIKNLLYGQSNLESILARENFHHFHTEFYPDHIDGESLSPRQNIEQVLRTCFDFIRSFPAGKTGEKSNLLLYGSTGVGKSFLSHCIADALLNQGYSVLYLSAHRLFEILADQTFRRNERSDEWKSETDGLIFTCQLLIIDDLGTELNNAFVNSSLFTCLNERLQAGFSTIINTNLSLEQINTAYSERIFSRLMESYIPLHIIGEDIRLKIAFSSLDEQ